MALTSSEQKELQSLEEELQELNRQERASYQPTAEDIAYAEEKTGVGKESKLKSSLLGLTRSIPNTYTAIKQLGVEAFGSEESKQKLRKEVEDEERLFSKIGHPGYAAAGKLVGDIATLAIPGTAAIKGLSALGKANAAVKAIGTVGARLAPKGFLGKAALTGAAGGTAGGLITPLSGDQTKTGQVGAGLVTGLVAGPALGYGVKGAGAAISKSMGLGRGFVRKLKGSPAGNKVLRETIEEVDITPAKIDEINATIQQFKNEGLEDILPPLHRMLNRKGSDDVFGGYVTSQNVKNVINRYEDRVVDTFEDLYREADDILALANGVPNSKMAPILSKAAANVQTRARHKATEASKEFYEAASKETVEASRVNAYLKSGPVKKAIERIKRDPEYSKLSDDISEIVYKTEAPIIKDARSITGSLENRARFDKLTSKSFESLATKDKKFVTNFADLTDIVKKANDTHGIAYLDLISRNLQGRAKDFTDSLLREGGDETSSAVASEVASRFNKFLKTLSPSLTKAKQAYSDNLDEYINLNNQGIGDLVNIGRKSVKSALNRMVNKDPEDFKDIVRVLNADTKGLGDYVGMTWLKNQLGKITSRGTDINRLTSFLTKPENMTKIKHVIQDPKVRDLYRKMSLISKYYYRPLGKGVAEDVGRVPLGVYEIREIAKGTIAKVSGMLNTPKVNYLLNSREWPKHLVAELQKAKSAKEAALAISNLIDHLGTLPAAVGGLGGSQSIYGPLTK